MKKILDKIFSHPELVNKPPVLVDVGASGKIHDIWKDIAKYSICLGFDADIRDFSLSETNEKGYKKLYLINRIVSHQEREHMDFYFTSSPHCSSTLPPNISSLKSWSFLNLFNVEEVQSIGCIKISQALDACGLDYIDWYKSDSQGTDLRIFRSIPESQRNKIIVAEFEPGIIDAYINEDKLYQLMAFMDNTPFWVNSMNIKGAQHITAKNTDLLKLIDKKALKFLLKTSPGWCEISYINNFQASFSIRELLLGWVFSLLNRQYGFALHLAQMGFQKFEDSIFLEMQDYAAHKIKFNYAGYFNLVLKRFYSFVVRFNLSHVKR